MPNFAHRIVYGRSKISTLVLVLVSCIAGCCIIGLDRNSADNVLHPYASYTRGIHPSTLTPGDCSDMIGNTYLFNIEYSTTYTYPGVDTSITRYRFTILNMVVAGDHLNVSILERNGTATTLNVPRSFVASINDTYINFFLLPLALRKGIALNTIYPFNRGAPEWSVSQNGAYEWIAIYTDPSNPMLKVKYTFDTSGFVTGIWKTANGNLNQYYLHLDFDTMVRLTTPELHVSGVTIIIFLSWTPIDGAELYEIFESKDSSTGPWRSASNVTGGGWTLDASSDSGSTIYYKVRARNAFGTSDFSNVDSYYVPYLLDEDSGIIENALGAVVLIIATVGVLRLIKKKKQGGNST